MKLSNAIITYLFSGLVASFKADARGRDLFLQQKKMKETYPLLCRQYYLEHTPFDHMAPMFFDTFFSLELPSDSPFVMKEFDELIFKKGNHQNTSLEVLGAFDKGVSEEIVKDLTFPETVALLKLEVGKENFTGIDEIDVDDQFKELLLSSPEILGKAPLLDKIKKFIDQGVSLGILEALINSNMMVFLENAHLSLWEGSFGSLLLDYALCNYMGSYDSYTLNYLENNVAARDWISSSILGHLPVEKIMLMLDFPERAEYIYKTPKDEALKSIFADVSDWRRDFVANVNWKEVRWQRVIRCDVGMTSSLLPFKGDLFFDSLVSRCDANGLDRMFGSISACLDLRRDYIYSRIINERRELVYLHLKNGGYPIQDAFATPTDELEEQIWGHFKTIMSDKKMSWLKFKAFEIIHDKLSLSYSQIAFGDEALLEEYFRRFSIAEQSALFFNLNVCLNEYLEENVKFHFKGNCSCNDLSCIHYAPIGGQDHGLFGHFKKAYLNEIGVEQFYPKLIGKLKQEHDIILRGLLYDILERIILTKWGSDYRKLFKVLKTRFDLLQSIEESAHFEAWSDDIQDLPRNIKRLYLLHHPQYILQIYSLDNLIETDKKILDAPNLAFQD